MAKERTLSCVPDVLGNKPNLPPTNPPAPAPEEKEKKQKIIKLDMSKFKSPMARKPTSSHPMPPATETTTSTMASTMVAATVPSSDKACKTWGLPCPFCAQSVLHPSVVDSDGSEEDWDGDIEREKRKEKQRKEEEVKQRQRIEEQEKMSYYYPPSPIYDPHPVEEILPYCTPQQKIELDPNYHPQTTSLN